jgi:hypothetical protein
MKFIYFDDRYIDRDIIETVRLIEDTASYEIEVTLRNRMFKESFVCKEDAENRLLELIPSLISGIKVNMRYIK